MSAPPPRRLLVPGALLLLALPLPALSACPAPPGARGGGWLSALRYRPSRVPVGTAFHYQKSNRDGSRAIRVIAYVATRNRLEVLKLEPPKRGAALVVAEMSWGIFSAVALQSWNLERGGCRRPQARAVLDVDQHRLRIWFRGREDVATLPRYPVHSYNFDLLSVAQLFRHLRAPRGAFRLGIFDPVWKRGGPLVAYKGPVTIRFRREVRCGSARCLVYAISGPGLSGATGTLWVHRERLDLQRAEVPVPDNPGWRDFRLILLGRERLTPAGWQRLIRRATLRLWRNGTLPPPGTRP